MGTLNVKAASKMAGINPHTLRAWERRYQAIGPSRSTTGRRLYTLEEVVRIRLLTGLVHRGHPISEIAALPTEKLRSLLGEAPDATPHQVLASPIANELRDQIMAAVIRFDLREVNLRLNQARVRLNARQFALEIVLPLLREIGMQVTQTQISISQEHAFSAILRHQLGQLLQGLGSDLGSSSGPRIAVSATEGDFHEFPILLAAIFASSHGLSTAFLGPNLPAQALADALQALRSNLLILSAPPLEKPVVQIKDYLLELRAALPVDFKLEVWVGGANPVAIEEISKGPYSARWVKNFETLDDLLSGLGPLPKTKHL